MAHSKLSKTCFLPPITTSNDLSRCSRKPHSSSWAWRIRCPRDERRCGSSRGSPRGQSAAVGRLVLDPSATAEGNAALAHARHGQRRSARGRGVSWTLNHAERQICRSLLRRRAGATLRLAYRKARTRHLRARPQRRRQDLAAPRHRRTPAHPLRQDPLGRPEHCRPGAASAPRGAVSATCRRAARFSAAQRQGEPRDRLCAGEAQGALHPRRDFRALSRSSDQ